MSADIIPENFLQKVFSYYGLTASSFIMLSGVFISQAGLEGVINPANWIVSSAASIIVAYSLRHYVSNNFIIFLSVSVFSYIVYLVFIKLHIENYFINGTTENNENLYAKTLNILNLFIPCFLFSLSLVSYKKHDLRTIEDLPIEIQEATTFQIEDNPLYYESFTIDANIEYIEKSEKNRVRIDLVVSMVFVNRSGQDIDQNHRYSKTTGDFRLNKLSVDGKQKDISDPSIHTGDGIRAVDIIPAKSSVNVTVSITEFFDHDDTHVYSCFDCSAKKFILTVSNLSPESLSIFIEKNNKDNAVYKREGNVVKWESEGALLPHQGARLVWRIK